MNIVQKIGLCIFTVGLVLVVMIGIIVFSRENAVKAEVQYQARMAQAGQAQEQTTTTYPIEIRTNVCQTAWIEIDPKSLEKFLGDVIERNVSLDLCVDNQNPPYIYVPTKNSGLVRTNYLGEFTSLKIRVSADSPLAFATYKYTLTHK